MSEDGQRLGPISHVAFLLAAMVTVALSPDRWLWLSLLAAVAFGLVSGGGGLRVLARPRLWVFVLSILALGPFVLGEPDTRWGVLRLSRAGLEMGFWMALRALTLMLVFGVSLGGLSIAQMMRLLDRLGLRGLGFALGVALNLGPALRDAAEAAYHTLRLRGGLRRPVLSARLFLVTVIANGLRYGDDVVKAALARGFDPARRPSSRRG